MKILNDAEDERSVSVASYVFCRQPKVGSKIERAAENCVKLESIDRKAEELMVDAGVFQTAAKQLKNKLWWKNMKIWFISGGAILVILGIIIAIVYTDTQSSQK